MNKRGHGQGSQSETRGLLAKAYQARTCFSAYPFGILKFLGTCQYIEPLAIQKPEVHQTIEALHVSILFLCPAVSNTDLGAGFDLNHAGEVVVKRLKRPAGCECVVQGLFLALPSGPGGCGSTGCSLEVASWGRWLSGAGVVEVVGGFWYCQNGWTMNRDIGRRIHVIHYELRTR